VFILAELEVMVYPPHYDGVGRITYRGEKSVALGGGRGAVAGGRGAADETEQQRQEAAAEPCSRWLASGSVVTNFARFFAPV